MDDTISRLAVIQIIEKMRARIGHNLERAVGGAMIEILDEVGEDVGKLPSAQPEKRTEERTKTHGVCLDAISRQAAIDAVQNRHMMLSKEKVLLINDLEKLPSAQPEIVRCKDCKHWIPYDWMFSEVWQSRNIDDYPEDEIGCNWSDMAMKANDFCSRGERRTE